MSKLVNITKGILCFSLVLCFFSCAQNKTKIDPTDDKIGLDDGIMDRKVGLTNDEFYKTMVKPRKKNAEATAETKSTEAPIPKISKLIAIPPLPRIGGDKTISFSVTEQVPLKDVLIELGRIAKIDVDLDPLISGGIILNARNRPLKEVIDRIATLGQLRYSYENGVLHFERDVPYIKNYFVDYLFDGQLWIDVEANITSLLSSAVSIDSADDAASLAYISSNKSAGIISVFATDKQHDLIKQYLADVEKTASAQVLIEAKVVEVTLTDEYSTGIQWTGSSSGGGTTLNTEATGFASDSTSALDYVISPGLFGSSLDVSVGALEKFGTTRTISSPRVHAINNQKATLNFADKLIYFKIDSSSNVTTSSDNSLVNSAITSTKQEEDVGVQLEITPSINLRTNEITMAIKPTLSVKSDEVTDPASPTDDDGNAIDGLENKVPVIQTREIDTIAKVRSGNIIIIGGLMKDTTSNEDIGIPFLSRIPIISWFFKSTSKESSIVETVIFIKATILAPATPPSKYDREFHNKFDSTKRPYLD